MRKNKTRFKEIKACPEKCSGCLSCQLACSFAYAKAFNIFKSRIIINFIGDMERTIDFTAECIKCGTCAAQCNYGALETIEWRA